MAKVLCIMPMEINTKVNLKIINLYMAMLLSTIPIILVKEKNTKVNFRMAKRMAKVLCIMPMEINTKVNLKITKRMAKVLCIMPIF